MENKLDSIVAELTAHNTAICDDIRDPKRVRMDAEYVNMVRHEGITIETICMMLTDAMESSSRLRTEKAQAAHTCNDTVLKALIEDCAAFPGGSAHFSTDMICGYLRELRSLRGIVEKQPKMRCGTPIGFFTNMYAIYGGDILNCGAISLESDDSNEGNWAVWVRDDDGGEYMVVTSHCFSTRALAEKALREAGK